MLMRALAAAGVAMSLLLAACATPSQQHERNAGPVAPDSVLVSAPLSPDLEARILAIDPRHVSDDDVRHVLAQGPTPRIVALHGGIYPVHLVMESFADFLIGMGYPEREIRDPGSHDLTHSPYEDARVLAGEIVWYYEHEGVRPMMVGHSQGGMQAVKVLYDLAGLLGDSVTVVDPVTHTDLGRMTFLDPLTGKTRPVTSFRVPYASSVGAGGLASLLPNQWIMAERTFEIPDTVEDFTGFQIGVDLIALDNPRTRGRYEAIGRANVRNVTLPAAYSHYYVANVEPLAKDAKTRAWLNAWTPALVGHDPPAGIDPENIQWAADVWYIIKEHWVTAAQKFVRARQAMTKH
jgi:hypothetical protein